jgi:hypothetical protein
MGLLSRLGKATGAAAVVGGQALLGLGERRDIKETAAAVKAEERSWDVWKLLRAEKITARSSAVTRKDKATEKIIDSLDKNRGVYVKLLSPDNPLAVNNLTAAQKEEYNYKLNKIDEAYAKIISKYRQDTLLPEDIAFAKKQIEDAKKDQKALEEANLIDKAEIEGASEIDSAEGVGIELEDEESGGPGVIDTVIDFIRDPAKYIDYEGTPLSDKNYNENQGARFKEYYGEEEWNALKVVIAQDNGLETVSDAEAAKLLNKSIRDSFQEKYGVGAAVGAATEFIKDFATQALEFFKGEIEKGKAIRRDREGKIIPEGDPSSQASADADTARYMAEAAGSQDIMKEGGLLGGGTGIIDTPPKYVEGEEVIGDPSVTWSPTDPAELMSQSLAGTQTGMPVAMDAGGAIQETIRTPIGKTTITLSDDIPEEATEKSARKERLVGKIKAIIISAEPNQGFQEAWTSISGGKDDPNLTSMKVKDIIKKHGHKAFGAGQFTYKDFMVPQVKKHLGKSQAWLDDQTFDIPFQNMLFTIGIEDAGIDEFLSGTKTAAQFQKALHNTWRALPKTVSTNKGDISDKHGNVVQTPGPEVGSEIMSTWTSQ